KFSARNAAIGPNMRLWHSGRARMNARYTAHARAVATRANSGKARTPVRTSPLRMTGLRPSRSDSAAAAGIVKAAISCETANAQSADERSNPLSTANPTVNVENKVHRSPAEVAHEAQRQVRTTVPFADRVERAGAGDVG